MAREAKDWAKSDDIRDQLAQAGHRLTGYARRWLLFGFRCRNPLKFRLINDLITP